MCVASRSHPHPTIPIRSSRSSFIGPHCPSSGPVIQPLEICSKAAHCIPHSDDPCSAPIMLDIAGKKIAVLMGAQALNAPFHSRPQKASPKRCAPRGQTSSRSTSPVLTSTVPADVLIAMNLIHGTFGEDGQFRAFLRKRGIPYTGAGVEVSRIAFDKRSAKKNSSPQVSPRHVRRLQVGRL
jgi:hypothetical protein